MSTRANKAREKLRAIKALADHPATPPDERAAARRMLERGLEREGLEESQLETPDVRMVAFSAETDYEEKLLIQLLFRYVWSYNGAVFRDEDGNMQFPLSEREADAIRVWYAIYREAWREECAAMFEAFVQQNEIYRPKSYAGDPETDEDKDKREKVFYLMQSVKKRSNALGDGAAALRPM